MAICDLLGNRLADTVMATDAEAGAVRVFERSVAAARELLRAARRSSW